MKCQLNERYPLFGSYGYKLFSWWDILQISADQFHRLSSVLMKFFLLPRLAFNQQNLDELAACIRDISKTCFDLELRLSKNQADLILNHLQTPGYTTVDILQKELEQLHTRMYEELQGELFLYISRDKAGFAMQDYWRGEPEIERAFP